MLSLLFGVDFYQQAGAEESPWLWDITLQDVADRGVMNAPTAIYIDDADERYYVVDTGNNRLLSYDRTGKFLSGFTANNQLQAPYDMIREPGVLWVVEKGKNSLTKIDLLKKTITPKRIIYQERQVFPDRLEMEDETLFLLDKAGGAIFSLDKDLNILKRFACKGCESGFVDFKVENNKIWALEQQEKAVYVFSLGGSLDKKIELHAEELDFARALAIDGNDLLYIIDRHKHSIAVFDDKGQFKYRFLQEGQARGQLYYPIEIRFDPWGRLFVVEEGNGRVQGFIHK